jgi:hypothetical protein
VEEGDEGQTNKGGRGGTTTVKTTSSLALYMTTSFVPRKIGRKEGRKKE